MRTEKLIIDKNAAGLLLQALNSEILKYMRWSDAIQPPYPNSIYERNLADLRYLESTIHSLSANL